MMPIVLIRLVPLALAFCLSLALATSALARQDSASLSDPDRTGDWLGVLQTPGGQLRLLITVQETETGFTGQLESLDQAPGQKMPLNVMEISAQSMHFEFAAAAASFTGQWSAANQAYVGTFTQGGSLPLEFSRPAPADVEAHDRPQEPQPPLQYHAESVRFENEQASEVILAGTLTLPRGNGSFPAAVLVSGSGPQDRDQNVFTHKTFAVLADHLTRNGIAVLRYDDRGFAESTGDFDTATSADFATDAEAAIAYLRSRPEIRPGAIGLIGHSEGGLIGPLVAASTPDLAYLVMLAGPGVDTQTLMLDQARRLARFQGVVDEDADQAETIQRRLIEIVASDLDDASAETALRGVLTDDVMAAIGENPELRDRIVRTMLRPWNRWFLRHDPAPWLEAMETPLLAIGGSLDVQVASQINLPAIETATQSNPDATIIMLDGLNHMFQTAETGSMMEYAQIEETFAPEALQLTSDWINERFAD